MKVDRFVELADDAQHLRAGLHVVVGVSKHATHDAGAGGGGCANPVFGGSACGLGLSGDARLGIGGNVKILQTGENDVVDVFDEFSSRETGLGFAGGVGDGFGPVAPTCALRYRGDVFLAVVGRIVLPSLFALIEDFKEEHPGELTDALGVAVDTVVFAHHVLDGLDGAAEIHEVGESGRLLGNLTIIECGL